MRRQAMNWILTAGVLVSAATMESLAQVTVKSSPPVVVATVPTAGDIAVDPGLTEVEVTFSKDMMTKQMWSWCSSSKDTFPEIDTTKIRYRRDKRTCVLPVKLQPGKTYEIWINSQKFSHFKDTEGHSAVPYMLVFQTTRKSKIVGNHAEKKAAMSVAGSWLRLIDEGDYGQAWENAAQFLKNAITKEQFTQALKVARGPLGKPQGKRKVVSRTFHTSLPGLPDGKYLLIQLNGSFANKKTAVETITPMLCKDGKWRVSGYYIK